ncbi:MULTISPECIES: restriction endonuclease subunit S [Bacteroidales]|nr:MULTISPECIES: restriction endonuclease subunit S [Bacteroidaceae]MDB1091593.1 restriction endonuclease subunit S [Phocaeicola vulgatus]MDC2242568.1 restriction endonuclease subunit S [Bacteroides thetaiotaomicron]
MANNNENKILNVPHLRFPEFSGEWKKCKLGDLCNVLMCKRILVSQTNTEDGVPFYKIGTIGSTPDAYISKELFDDYKVKYNYPRKGEVMITCAGTVGKCVVYDGEDAYFQDSNIVWIDNPTQYISNGFLFHLLSKVDWRKLNSTTIIRIYNDDLRNLKMSYPRKEEQQKISHLLSLLDERIATQNKIIEDLKKLKSAIIEIEYSPKDSYHSHIGGAIVQISKRNKDNHLCNVLSVSNRQGFIKQSEQFEDRNVASDDTSNYKIVEKNDFAYNPARINVGSIARLTKFETGIVSPMYICFRTKDCLLPEYLELFFESRNFFYHIQKRLEGSVRLCLSYEELCNIPIVIPSIEKQKQVDLHLSKLAQKIDLEMKILQFVQQQKTYLLHQMFI